jgi:hypothetical protein
MKLRWIIKILASVVCLFMMFGTWFYVAGTISPSAHTFIGVKTFSSLEEMQTFQTEVVTVVKDAGGRVDSFDLTVSSPPEVEYRLYIPGVTEFQYGTESMSPVLVGITIGMGSLLIAVIGFVAYRIIWIKR